MRVRGNVAPAPLTVELYPARAGYVEVRLRENIKTVVETDTQTQAEITMYEYDEYTFHVPNRDGLRNDIESNLADWIATGRTVEVNESASIVQEMQSELKQVESLSAQNAEYEAALSEIETTLGVNT